MLLISTLLGFKWQQKRMSRILLPCFQAHPLYAMKMNYEHFSFWKVSKRYCKWLIDLPRGHVVINAENAALKSDSFTLPNLRAREGALKAHSTMAHQFSETRPRFEDEMKRTERPKSAGAQRVSRGSMRSLRSALVDNRPITPDLPPPPVPVSSRSSMLRDWKNLTRRRSSGGPTIASHHNNSNSNSGTTSPSSSRGPSPLLMHSQQRPILLEDTKTALSSAEGS